MFKFIERILFGLFFIFFLLPHQTNAQEKVKNVVIFFAYGSNLPAFNNILKGLNSTIHGKTNEPVNIIQEYFDLSRSVNDEYAKFIITMYNKKLTEFNVDLLITVGPGVNAALSKYGSSELKALKMINIDLDLPGRMPLSDLNHNNGIEVILKFQAGKTIKEALALFPENRNVFVISGVSSFDSFYTSMVRQCKSEFEPFHTFKFISGLSMDSTIRFVKTIPLNSIVLVPAYLKDADDIPFTTPEALEMISKNSPAPVFLAVTDAGVRAKGNIGGYLFSYVKLGEEVGKASLEILHEKPIGDVTINENAFFGHFYDWNELRRWHLTDSKAIPANSIFYNKDISFLEMYKWYILGLLIFLFSQTLLIIYLYRLNKRQKAITIKMEETERMHRDLMHTDRLSKMSTLTASLSHELFQPLAAIKITAQAGKRFVQSGKLDMSKASQMFDNILEDDQRATGIITSVKSLMKPESTVMGNINLNALIEDTADIIRSDAKKQRIKIEINLHDSPVFIFADKIQIQQVLMNFIRNATVAMEKCNPENRNLEISLSLNKETVTVSVHDSGPGIDAAIKEKLFKPFVTTKKDGFGIGLTLCRSIIDKHNGKIWVDSVPEGGATFSFSLPYVKNPNDE
jgi:signal transduction histidine kinase